MLQHSAILSTFIKFPPVIKISVLSISTDVYVRAISEWPFYTGFTVLTFS